MSDRKNSRNDRRNNRRNDRRRDSPDRRNNRSMRIGPNDRNWTVALLLSLFLPGFERFYLGCPGTGIVKIITCCGCGCWILYDIIMIATGSTLCGNTRYFNGPEQGQMRGGKSKGPEPRVLFKQKCHFDYVGSAGSLILGIIFLFLVIKPYFYTRKYRNLKELVKQNMEGPFNVEVIDADKKYKELSQKILYEEIEKYKNAQAFYDAVLKPLLAPE
jgi:TM2 domain-containing membrane protein YozV